MQGFNPTPGVALTYTGGNQLYTFFGQGSPQTFYNYSIPVANSWNQLTNTPAAVGPGGALTNDGSDYIYGLAGNNLRNFSRYSIATNTWTVLNNTLFAVGWGGSLAYAQATGSGCYLSNGSIASVVLDTTTPNSRWDLLVWNATIPPNTALNMSVRANNTLFLQDAAAPPWTPVIGTLSGGKYVVAYPNLPSGQYLQWRANLSSTACSNTSVLYNVTVYYSDWYTPPAVTAVSPFSTLLANPPVTITETVTVPATTATPSVIPATTPPKIYIRLL